MYLLRLHLDLHKLICTLAARQAQLRLPSQAACQVCSLLKHRHRIAYPSKRPLLPDPVTLLFRIVHSD